MKLFITQYIICNHTTQYTYTSTQVRQEKQSCKVSHASLVLHVRDKDEAKLAT